jgi:hypothetical protein
MFDFFRKIVEYFNSHHISYMVSGSIAMGLYVVPRSTRDIDFVVNLQQSDVVGLSDYFGRDYECDTDAINDAVSRQSMFNIIDPASGFKADFVVLKNQEYRLTEFERRQIVDVHGMTVYVVSPEDLLISKLIWIQEWQSAVQMEDIKNLYQFPGLQKEYLFHWIKKLDLNTFDLLS